MMEEKTRTFRVTSVFLFAVCLMSSGGCSAMKELRAENESLKGEVARLHQVEKDYSHELQELTRLSGNEKVALQSEMEQMRSQLNDTLDEQIQRNDALVEKIRDLTVIEIGEDNLFGSGQIDLTQEGLTVLKSMISVLENYPDYHIRVEGHTDSIPIGESLKAQIASNWELSTLRATTVVRYMIYGLKIEPERLSAVGFAHYRPIDSNDTEEGRARNRRIRMVVFKMM